MSFDQILVQLAYKFTQLPLSSIILISAGILVLVLKKAYHHGRRSPQQPRPSINDAKPVQRHPGTWLPSSFKRPAASPYPNWSLQTTQPLPYRPFRYGNYHITMGLRKMSWDTWIELDNQYPLYHKLKTERILERGPMLSRTAPEAADAACELLEELCSYLPERYPSLFRKTNVGMENLFSCETFDIRKRPLAEDPMQMAARMIQDDIALMLERSDGKYYFLAGCVLLPGSWRLKDKFGMQLSDIHISGHVPGYKAKLQTGMDRFFCRIKPEEPWMRNNYYFQVGGDLGWNHSLGPEGFDELNEDAGGEKTVKHHWNSVAKQPDIEEIYFRSERQSLRRLQRTGAVVFTSRTYLHPVVEIAREPEVPGRLAAAVRSWGNDVARYKGREVYKDVLLAYLDGVHREQIENGLMVDVEEERYPW